MAKRTVVFDFDGVIHSYKSGWKGDTIIHDPPVPGIREEIHRIRESGYEVVVVSSRCRSESGRASVTDYMMDNCIEFDAIVMEKPPAIVYVDDRALRFDGDPAGLLEQIQAFVPWTESRHD